MCLNNRAGGSVMKKSGGLFLAELLLIISFGALRVSLQLHSVSKIIFSLCIAFLGVAVFVITELRADYIARPVLYKSASIFFFLAGNMFYGFAFCFDFKLHQYSLLYCAVTVLLLMPAVLLSKIKK